MELNKLVMLLTDNPNLRIQIDGHTDNVGQANDNLLCSPTTGQKQLSPIYRVKALIPSGSLTKGFGSRQTYC